MKINFHSILKTCFLLSAFLIVLPNKIKEIPFALLGLFSIIFYFREKLYNKKDIILFLYFSVLTVSLLYTSDLKYGFRYLESQLPFFYLPFTYLVFNRKKMISDDLIKKWIQFFNLSIFLFFILFLTYFLFQFRLISYNNIRTALDTIPLLGIHPIYISIIVVLALFTNLHTQNKHKVLQYIFICINLFLLVMSGVRATLLFFPIIMSAFFLMSKLRLINKIYVVLLILVLSFGVVIFNKDFTKRLSEISNPSTYTQVNLHNSTSIRNTIWDCALIQAKYSNPIIGEGLGDTRGLLQKCYDSKYPELNKYYNTHNQYLSIYISLGIIGLFTIVLFLYSISKSISPQNRIYFIFTLIFYLYMFIFENVLERKYGVLIFLTFLLFIFNNNQKKSN
jgi:O-antigen ligase